MDWAAGLKGGGMLHRSKGGRIGLLSTVCLAVFLAFVVAVPSYSQNATGTILGAVKDTQGGVIVGATVTIRSTETGLTRTLTTGEDGLYRAPALPVGTYSIKIEKQGFKTSTHDGLVLSVTEEMLVNFEVEVGASTQEIVVTGEAPQVETTNSTLGGLVDEKRMADLPLNGRNYADLTLLQLGVSRAVNAGNINVPTMGTWMSSNGAPLRSNNFTLDGARLNNMQGATSASIGGNTLGVDGIREYRVITDMFGAEYGLGMGAQVVMTSRSGTNQFHGDAFDYLRNAIFDANVNRPLARAHGSTSIVPRPAHIKNNFGGAMGGPVVKDKMFIFATYEGIREVVDAGSTTHVLPFGPAGCSTGNVFSAAGQANMQPILAGSPDIVVNGHTVNGDPSEVNACLVGNLFGTTANPAVGTAQAYVNPYSVIPASLAPYPSDQKGNYVSNALNRNGEDFGQMRFDYIMSTNDSLFVRYTEDNFHGNSDSKYPEYGIVQTSRNYFVTLGENHVFSPTLLNSARLSFSRTFSDTYNYVKTANAATSGIPFWAACPTLDCTGTTLPIPAQTINGVAYPAVPATAVTYSFSNNSPTGAPCPTGAFIVGYGAPGNFGTTGCNDSVTGQNIYTLSEDMFYTKGKHAVKFGALINRFNQIVGPGGGNNNSLGGEVQFGNPAFLLGGIPFPFWDLRTPGPLSSTYWTYMTYGFYAQDDYRATSRLMLNLGFRYEFNTTPSELNGRQYTHHNLSTDSFAGQQGSIMQNSSLKNFSPRVGFGYDVFGNGKTAVRGGFGIYYDVGNIGTLTFQDVFSNGNNTPTGATYWVGNPVYSYSPAFHAPFPTIANIDPRNDVLHTVDYYSKQPHILQYNLTVQQQLPGKMALQVGYVGSRGINLYRLIDQNPFNTIQCTGPNCIPGQPFWGMDPTSPQGRINPNFANATMLTTGSSSWYNALEVALNMKNYHGMDVQTAYTFSRNLDTAQGQQYVWDCFTAAGSGQGINPTNPNGDKGPTCFDATHNLRVNFLYHFPNLKSNGFLSKVANGWWMGNIISIQSGYPFNVNTAGLISNSGVFNFDQGERPNIVTPANFNTANAIDQAAGFPGAVLYDPHKAITGNPDGWFNPLMFTLVGPNADAAGGQCAATYATSAPNNNASNYGNPAYGPTCYFGYLGNEPRNDMRGAPLRNWDFSINKDTRLPFLGENGMLEFRAEMFNLLNHANWGFISNTVFAACAPFANAIATVAYVPPSAGNNGACGGSNESAVDYKNYAPGPPASNWNGVGPMRQMQFALKVIF
jgi:hypothetical protein